MADIHDLYSSILSNVHMELPHKTMSKKLIVNVAPTGSFMNRQQNPGQPYTMEENVRAAIEAYKAGAAVWHVHARDTDGTPSKDPHVLKETIARVLEKCPDIVTSVVPYADYDQQGVDLLKRTVDVLTHAGPEFFQSAVLLIQTTGFSEKFTYIITEKTLSEQVRYLEDHGVRPEYQATSYQGIKDVLDWLVSKGIAKDPPLMNIMMGFHGFSHGAPLGPDPWNYIYMMTMQQNWRRKRSKAFAPEAAIGCRSRRSQSCSGSIWCALGWRIPFICILTVMKRSRLPLRPSARSSPWPTN
jgi:uncharacterized protein (DUF849 family)